MASALVALLVCGSPVVKVSAVSSAMAADDAEARAPLVGVWERPDGTMRITLLPDGRAAFLLKSPRQLSVRAQIGRYTVTGSKVHFDWLLDDPEDVEFQLDGDSLTFPGKVLTTRYQRSGGMEEAASDYAQILGVVRKLAEASYKAVPVGPVKPGTVRVNEVIPDSHASEVFAGATVYSDGARFQWLQTPVHQYARLSPNEPGVTCCSYTFLPNGRFFFDGWLYGILMDADKPFDERNAAEVRGREVPVHHQQFWGRYRVIPGKDPLDGDTVETVANDGSKQTIRVVAGRRYMITGKPRMLFNNWEEVKKEKNSG